MKGFLTFTVMNLKMYLRDVQMVFWTLMFPIILMSLLGVAFGAIGDVTFNVAVIDNDDSETSQMFIDTLKDVNSLDVSTPSKLSDARSKMKDGEMDIIIVIPVGFEKTVQANYDGSNSSSNSSYFAFADLFEGSEGSPDSNSNNESGSGTINLTVYYNDADLDKSFSALAIVEKVSTNLNKGLTGREDIIILQPEKTTGGDFEFIDYIAPGILAMSIMQTGIYGMSLFIVSARQKGILKRIQATPVQPAMLLASRVIVSLIIIGMQATVLLGIAFLVFDVQIAGNLLVLMGMITIGSVVFIMLGFLISSVSKTTESADSFSSVISMPMMFLGDVFIPISVLPGYVQFIAKLMPLTYLSDTFRKIMLHGSGPADFWTNIVILMVFGIVMFAGAVKLFRWEK